MSIKHYLVTGGLGFLGAALTRALLARGHTVRVLDNGSRGSAEKLGDVSARVEIVPGDIRDAADVRNAVCGVDAVCHLAFINGTEFFYSKPAVVLEVGVKGIMNVLDACLAENVRELILASSSEVYQTPPRIPTAEDVPLSVPDPFNPRYSYGGGKIISELLAINYGREHFDRLLIFRPHNVYGPAMGWEHVIPQFVTRMMRLARETRRGAEVRFPIEGDGNQTRAFVYVDDFTDGLVTMIERGEHMNVYHIGSQDERSIADVAYGVARALDLRIELLPGAEAAGGTLRRCPDIRKLAALGYAPRVPFEEGLRRTVAWYRDALHAEAHLTR